MGVFVSALLCACWVSKPGNFVTVNCISNIHTGKTNTTKCKNTVVERRCFFSRRHTSTSRTSCSRDGTRTEKSETTLYSTALNRNKKTMLQVLSPCLTIGRGLRLQCRSWLTSRYMKNSHDTRTQSEPRDPNQRILQRSGRSQHKVHHTMAYAKRIKPCFVRFQTLTVDPGVSIVSGHFNMFLHRVPRQAFRMQLSKEVFFGG